MFIVYGSREYKKNLGPVAGLACATCEKETLVAFAKLGYQHLFWIPFLPTKKELGVLCANCGHSSSGTMLLPQHRPPLAAGGFRAKAPLHHYLGFVLILSIATAIGKGFSFSESWSGVRPISASQTHIRELVPGDVIVFDLRRSLPKIFAEKTRFDPRYPIVAAGVVHRRESGVTVRLSANSYETIWDAIEHAKPAMGNDSAKLKNAEGFFSNDYTPLRHSELDSFMFSGYIGRILKLL